MNSQLTLNQMGGDSLPLLEALFQNSSDICLLLSSNLDILAINPKAESLYQWKAQDVLNKNFQALCLAYGYDFLLNPDALIAVKQSKTIQITSFGIGLDTSKQKIQWKLSSAFSNAERVILWIGAFTHESGVTAGDVNNIWLSMPGNLFWKDKEGVYLGATNRMAMALGFKRAEDVIGKTDYDLFSQQQADILRSNDREITNSGMPKIVEEIVTLSGTKRILCVEKIPLLNNNEVIGIVGNSLDITHLKSLESELREARELAESAQKTAVSYLEHIVECMPGSLYWKDKEGIYLGCNNLLVEMLNLGSQNDIVGKTDYDLWPEQAEALRANDEEVMQSEQSVHLEETVMLPNGKRRYYTVVKLPLKDPQGNIVGIIGNSLDITNLKRITEELKQAKENAEIANKAKSDFLAVISHEFRIPLTGILGMAQLMRMQNLTPEKQQEYVQHISSAGMHLLNLINDILDFAKMEAGKFELALAPMDLSALIEETCTMLTPLAKPKNLELLINFEQTPRYQILGDKRVLRQIIINLLGNAIKFTEKGYVSIHVECIQETSNTVILGISVSDTGIGIPEDKQEMVFDHFSQVDASHSRRYGGAGLGLTITKQLIELMSGTISLTSQVGKGSTFRCVIGFPLQKSANMTSPWMVYQSIVRILIVDDTRRGEVMRKQLSPSNSQVVSGKEAFNTLLASYQLTDLYDIVIIDQRLNDVDPLQLAKTICQHKELHQPMLALLTDNGSMDTKESAKKAGFFECIVKPIQPLALQTVLTAAWERWIEQKNNLCLL